MNSFREQRYTRLARWEFVQPVAEAAGEIPLWVCGDILSWEDYYNVSFFFLFAILTRNTI